MDGHNHPVIRHPPIPTDKSHKNDSLSMVHEERIEIIKLFLAVFAGFATAGAAGGILGDPLSTILVSVSAIVIIYYILSYAESILVKKRKRND